MEPAAGLPAWRAIEFARLLAMVEGERRFFQQLFANLPFPVAVYDEDGVLELANPAFLRRFGVPLPDVSKARLGDLFATPDAQAQAGEVLANGSPHFAPATTVVTPCGVRSCDVGFIRLRRPAGEGWHLLVSCQDTAVAAPAVVSAPAPAPVSGSAPSRRMADHLDAVFWEMDPATFRFRRVSARAAEITGIGREEWRTPAEFSQNFVHPQDRESYLEFFGERLQREDAPALEYRIFPPFGAARWLRDEIRPAFGPDGHLEAYAGLTFDITRRKMEERDRIEAGKSAAVEHLSARVSHVANNLLMIIGGYAADLRDAFAEGDARRDDVDTILKASERLTRLTRQLGQLTRPAQAESEEFDLREWMPDLIAALQAVLGPEMAVDAVLPAQAVPVRGNRALLQSLFEDAVRLASHALTPVSRLMLIGAQQPAHARAELSLVFSGVEFSDELHDRFFEPFAGPKEQGVDPPLGLAAHLRALPLLGATARLEGEPGEDPRLVLHLKPATGAAATPAPSGEAKYTVLLVDDEPGIRALVRKSLQHEGYLVLEAPTTSEALRIAEHYPGPLDLLLSDVDLPETGGVRLAEDFRDLRPSTPVLFMTGNPADLPPNTLALKKPFPLPALIEAVRRVLHGHAGMSAGAW